MPVYNGEATIGRALDSLLAQDYPQDRYEIIVVNDGSTDETFKVVAERPAVRYVELPRNMGIPTAQNAGLEAAQGEIFAAFNDDCQAASDYLTEIAAAYLQLDKPLGVGGLIVKQRSGKVTGVTANYIEAIGTVTNQGVGDAGPSFVPAVARRFFSYLRSNYSAGQEDKLEDYPEVVELYGSNASFPISKLRQIGGWDTSMAAPAVGGIEDRDVCFRLRQRFPDHRYYNASRANLMFDQDPRDSAASIKSYLLRPYRRGPFNYAFHVKNGLTPPLFPFPPLMLLILLADVALATQWPALIAFLPALILLLPQLCYGWWVKRAVADRRPLCLLFPYFQAAEETMVLVGLVKGSFTYRRMTSGPRPVGPPAQEKKMAAVLPEGRR